jgi:hypothetical protein
MFAVFFIMVSLLSTTPFLKKSKSIGLQLRQNSWEKKKLDDQIKKIKILHIPSTIIHEMMNSAHQHIENPMSFIIVF